MNSIAKLFLGLMSDVYKNVSHSIITTDGKVISFFIIILIVIVLLLLGNVLFIDRHN